MSWILFTIFIFGAFASEESKNCPGNHSLKNFTPLKHFSCDECDNLFRNKTMYGCRICDFDLCSHCYGKSQNQFSKDNGVSCTQIHVNRWQVQLVHNKNLYLNAVIENVFNNEEYAAMIENLLYDKYKKKEHSLKFGDLITEVDTIQKDESITSQYTGVFWNHNLHKWQVTLNYEPCYVGVTWKEKKKKWHALLTHNQKNHDGGLFDSQVTASMSVNLLCDKIKINRKNPTNIQFEEIIQAINDAINKIILFDLQQVAQIFKTQTPGPLWPLLDSPVKEVILQFLITDYNPTMHKIEVTSDIIEDEPHIVEEESHIVEEESHNNEEKPNIEKRKRTNSNTLDYDYDLEEDKIQ